jgi:hypothetical protein
MISIKIYTVTNLSICSGHYSLESGAEHLELSLPFTLATMDYMIIKLWLKH